ncbi:MAG: hypothetical protein ABDH18_00640 [Aquificaceae bacterium]
MNLELNPEIKPSINISLLNILTKTSQEVEEEIKKYYPRWQPIKCPSWFYENVTYQSSDISSVENQIRLELSGNRLKIAMEIISWLDQRGYFIGNINQIAKDYNSTSQEVESIRRFIATNIEPLGTASLNFEEYITIQLNEFYPEELDLVQEVLSLLRSGVKTKRALRALSTLKLTPFESSAPAIEKRLDIVIHYELGEWYISLMDELLFLNAPPRWREFLKYRAGKLRFLIQELIKSQEEFLLGKGPLKPLKLKDMAKTLNLSISSLSRLVSRKLIKTPVGSFSLRELFCRESIDGISTNAIKEAILKVLKTNPEATDEVISKQLQSLGLKISRRTVSKYRSKLR